MLLCIINVNKTPEVSQRHRGEGGQPGLRAHSQLAISSRPAGRGLPQNRKAVGSQLPSLRSEKASPHPTPHTHILSAVSLLTFFILGHFDFMKDSNSLGNPSKQMAGSLRP